MPITLTKRNYVGQGYVHIFQNNKTGEILNVPCTQEIYEAMGKEGGEKFNPTLVGYTWISSVGDVAITDSPDLLIKEGEYYEKDNKYVVMQKYNFLPYVSKVTTDKITNDTLWQ